MSARRGVVVFIVLLAVLGAAVLFAALTLRGSSASTPAATVLMFDVPAELDEDQPRMGDYSLDIFQRERPTLWMIVNAIRAAAKDSHVEGMVLHVSGIDWGWAKVAEVRAALREFRRTGKPLYASFAGGGEREYLLASTAGTVSAPPLAVIQLDGLTASALFLRGTLDKIGVTPNFSHVGQYKSGVEGYTRTGMSEPARRALEALLDDTYDGLVDSLAVARAIPADSVLRLLDEGPYTPHEALARGLIDTVLHEPDLDSLATRATGHRHPTLSLTRYLERLGRPAQGTHVALVVAAGTIASGRSRGGPGDGQILGSETLNKALREVRSRSSIKAVVLRVDSPGGSAQASDEIWREVERCRSAKPLIVSMSDLAASGGYYIAVPADSIVAQPATITGSIGVYGGKLNILGLYRKLGLNVETVSRGRHAGMLSPYRNFTPEEAARFQDQMEAVYREFIRHVAGGRKLRVAEVDSIAQGRVWSGRAALERGLVDDLGGLERAFAMARARAGLPADEELIVDVYPRIERTFLQRMLAGLFSDEDFGEAVHALRLPPALGAWMAAAEFPAGVALALLPWSIEIR